MFEVGDKVNILKPYVNGHVGLKSIEVLEVDKSDNSVKLNLSVYSSGNRWWYEFHRLEKVEDNMFTKDMLVAGKHVVEQKNGDLALFMVDGFSYLDRQGTNGLSWWNANLTSNYVSDQTIVKVYEVETSQAFGIYAEGRGLKLVWTRQEKTEAEKQLDELDKKIAELQEQADKVRKSMQDE